MIGCIYFFLFISLSYSINPLILWSDSKIPIINDELVTNIDLKFNYTEHFLNILQKFDRINVFLTDELSFSTFKQKASANPVLNSFIQNFIDSNLHEYHWTSSIDSLLENLHYSNHDISFEHLDSIESTFGNNGIEERHLYVYSLPHNMNITDVSQKVQSINHILNSEDYTVLNILSSVNKKPTIAKIDRQIREDSQVIPPMKTTGLVDDGTFFNIKNCIYLYVYSIEVLYDNQKIPLSLTLANTDKSLCQDKQVTANLEFKNNYKEFSVMNVVMNFALNVRSWSCTNIDVIFTDLKGVSTTVNYGCRILKANTDLSYSCYSMNFTQSPVIYPNPSVLNFKYIQVQPFVKSSNQEIFGYSDTCSYFVTIPILMGIFLFIIVALIVGGGLISILQIKGHIRPQNPKEFFDMGAVTK